MKNRDWVKVLETMYENSNYWSLDLSKDLEELSNETGINQGRLKDVLGELDKQDLISRNMDEVHLTERGFDHVNNLHMHEEQLTTDRILLVFTTVLAIGIIALASVGLSMVENPVFDIILYSVYAIIFIVIGALFSKKFDF